MMKSLRILIAVVFTLCFALLNQPLMAQTFPSSPVQMVIPMAPGDSVDVIGRTMANEMTKLLKTPVIPVNKVGGGGAIGADYVVRSKKDGYTFLFANSNIYYTHAMNPETVPYNPLTDLEPLCLAISSPLTVPVLADSPWKTFQELMTYMKQNPGKIRGSSSGVGSVGHFNFELIRLETGNAINMIPYKGASPAMAALLGGHVETSTLAISLIAPHVTAGKLRPLAISQKVPEFPDIPTLKDLGYKRDLMSVRFAFYVPVGLPDNIKQVLTAAIEKTIKAPDVVKVVHSLGTIEDFVRGPEFKKMMIEEHGMVIQLLKSSSPATK
jgi:tripartite-type tricarboxylate transporter receptor subunit TctC